MKALRCVLVTAAAALASLVLAVPAGAINNNGTVPVKPVMPVLPVLPLPKCPKDGSIELFKAADRTDYNLNDVVTFTLKVRADVCDAMQVMVHDTLPAGLTVGDPSVLNHDFGTIGAGTEKSFSFQAVAVTKGTLTNAAHASGYSVGPDETPCERVPPPVVTRNPVLNTQSRIIVVPPYSCPRSSDAEVTIKVTAPSGNNPTPPPPTQPPSNLGTPSLPNTGHQG